MPPVVPRIPLMDYVGRPLLACIFLVLLLLQWRFPLRRQHFSVVNRLVRNFVLSLPGFGIVRFAMLPIPISVAIWAEHRRIGLLNWLSVPGWAAGIATFLLMDYAYWWWHWANHMVPLFWRFHNVHHTDLDLDVSTAARFHFAEMKSRRRAHVEVEVGMVHIVKTPKQRDHMVGPMPPPICVIHEQKGCDPDSQSWQTQPVQ